ncbi:hypothetical protein [Chitinophaga ginsengisegetis]|uniref:hypothetical protein n=1 Tax=Chitinophaga ginsengisegetis TaxID=393003 RepID=UPI000DB9014E|nr:hypothetical protein [Chitinophaga ginsengisegetis]MDR6645221.1 hypothetical protein [Chitinophaga ginsengisegetis]
MNQDTITNLLLQVRMLKASASLVVEEAIKIEKNLECVNMLAPSTPGQHTRGTLSETDLAKIKERTNRILAKAMSIS